MEGEDPRHGPHAAPWSLIIDLPIESVRLHPPKIQGLAVAHGGGTECHQSSRHGSARCPRSPFAVAEQDAVLGFGAGDGAALPGTHVSPGLANGRNYPQTRGIK